MKKYQAQLLKIANKFQNKYAQSQDLKQILLNASGWGQSSVNGIMNFMDQLKKDQATMYITITISNGTFGGKTAKVNQPLTDPREVAVNYSRLPEQIEKYLNKHLSTFPQIPDGDTTLTFSGTDQSEKIVQR